MTQTISAHQARQNLGELIAQAHYQGKRFLIKRRNKPVASLVSATELQLLEAIDKIPGLADTIAIELNPDLAKHLKKSIAAGKKGETVPLESLLED